MDGTLDTVEETAAEITEADVEEAAEQLQEKGGTELVAGGQVQAIVPVTLQEAWSYAGMVIKADMAPSSYKTPAQVLVGIVKGMELGMPPLTALQSIYVVNGRPTIWGDGALALVWRSGFVRSFKEWHEEQDDKALCRFLRKEIEDPIERSFSMADATKAGLAKKSGPWTNYPRRMMQMRARAWAMRDGFADVLMGLAITEEVADIPGHRMVTGRDGNLQIESTTVDVENPLDDDEAA